MMSSLSLTFGGIASDVINAYMAQTIKKLVSYSLLSEFFFANFGSLLSFVHLLILCRKSMQTSSNNIILVGIAICDLVCMVVVSRNGYIMLDFQTACVPPRSLNLMRFDWFLTALHNALRRCSAWLAMLMAVVRYLVITNITIRDSRFSTPGFGLKIASVAFFISVIFTLLFYTTLDIQEVRTWVPDAKCVGLKPTYTVYAQKENQFSEPKDDWFWRFGLIMEGVFSKFIPCFTLPIITVFLVFGMKKSLAKTSSTVESAHKSVRMSRANRTTILTILIAGTFFISEFPLGVVDLYKGIFVDDESSFRPFSLNLVFICDAIFSINASIHCLIIFIMSTQYRRTVWSTITWLNCCKSRNTSSIAAFSSSF